MDSQSSFWYQSIPTMFTFLFFSFTICFSIFSLLLFIMSQLKPWCNCQTCRSYLTNSWSDKFNNLCDWYAHLLRQSPTGTIHVHVLGNIITTNEDNIEYILKTRFANYPKGKTFSAILGDLLGNGIFNVDGESWNFQRKMASLELGSVSVRSYAFDIVKNEIHNRLIPLLSSLSLSGSVLDLQDVFRRFSFDTICKFSFGIDPGCLRLSLPVNELATAFDLAAKVSAERAMAVSPLIWKTKRFLNIGTEKELKEAIKKVDVLAKEIIDHRREMGFSTRNDLLSRFMSSVDDDKYLRDIVVSFLLAGRDTVASALTSFIYLLSNNPKIKEGIREESNRIMGQTREFATYEEMRRMHYLQACIHESLRLYPPVQFDSKFCQEDDVLPDGMFVKKGTRVTYHPYAMGRMERVWGTDCDEFRPERWLEDGVFSSVSAFKYPVFQGGLRVCLGKEMALMEVQSVALSLIRRFDIKLAVSTQTLRFAPGLTATVQGGLMVKIGDESAR